MEVNGCKSQGCCWKSGRPFLFTEWSEANNTCMVISCNRIIPAMPHIIIIQYHSQNSQPVDSTKLILWESDADEKGPRIGETRNHHHKTSKYSWRNVSKFRLDHLRFDTHDSPTIVYSLPFFLHLRFVKWHGHRWWSMLGSPSIGEVDPMEFFIHPPKNCPKNFCWEGFVFKCFLFVCFVCLFSFV